MTTMLKVTADNELIEVNVSTLAEMQSAVGGYIELITFPIGAAYLNEEGKFNGSKPNKIATHIWEATYGADTDVLHGDVLFFGGVDGNGNEEPIQEVFKKILESVALNAKHW